MKKVSLRIFKNLDLRFLLWLTSSISKKNLDFQPQPSTSKAFHKSEKKNHFTLDSDDESYDKRREELENMTDWNIYSETEDEGELMNILKHEISFNFHTNEIILILCNLEISW